MAELKTKKNDQSVEAFLNRVEDETKRQDCFAILDLMKQATGSEPAMWGDSIIGFGNFNYQYDSGRQIDWFLVGFAPRKKDITLYLMPGISRYEDLLKKLGKHKTGKGCLHVKRLADIDQKTLRELVKQSVAQIKKRATP